MKQDIASIGFMKSSDTSDSYEEVDVPLSDHCHLVGVRSIAVRKAFTHKIKIALNSVVTVIRNGSAWYMADENGNYDLEWRINDNLKLENVKLMQGLVIRGTLKDTSYWSSKKYCKQLGVNREGFFDKDNIPVMTAKIIFIESNGGVFGRGIK